MRWQYVCERPMHGHELLQWRRVLVLRNEADCDTHKDTDEGGCLHACAHARVHTPTKATALPTALPSALPTAPPTIVPTATPTAVPSFGPSERRPSSLPLC